MRAEPRRVWLIGPRRPMTRDGNQLANQLLPQMAWVVLEEASAVSEELEFARVLLEEGYLAFGLVVNIA